MSNELTSELFSENNPNIKYPETILIKSKGFTDSEVFLGNLCDNTFLSFWSYPNIFRDQGRTKSNTNKSKGDGKEVCDLLVVFENHIIIFSDKYCKFPKSGNIMIDWSRWFKKAIYEASNQIFGAERWIFQFPNNLYIDKECKTPFPFKIPSRENAIVHRIIVAHGASKECIKYLGGTGSLMLNPEIIGNSHMYYENNNCTPFMIGQINPKKGFTHVFDDANLEIVLETLDTIYDFINYLAKKEQFITSGKNLLISGEEDLLAVYLNQTNENGEHTFETNLFSECDTICIEEGLWEDFSKSQLRLNQVKANEISYSWDKLIEKFVYHITSGTSYLLSPPDINSQENILRFLARENRTRRRFLAESINTLILKTPLNTRATRTIFPSLPGDPYYLFLLFPKLDEISWEKYRQERSNLLLNYLKILKSNYPLAKDLIGIATETGNKNNRSEDIVFLDVREWSPEQEKEAKELEVELTNIGYIGKKSFFRTSVKEYPHDKPSRIIKGMKGNERNLPCFCGSGKKMKKCCGKRH